MERTGASRDSFGALRFGKRLSNGKDINIALQNSIEN